MLGLPETVDHYDYGLKSALDHMEDSNVKKEDGGEDGDSHSSSNKENKVVVKSESKDDDSPDKTVASGKIEFPEDAFLMVTQVSHSQSA